MDAAELLQLRLARQMLAEHPPVTPGDVVRRLGAVQAQDLPGAKWALAFRSGGGLTEDAVDQAIAEKQVVRSWPMRGTLHFVAPEDLRWMLDVTTPKLFERAAARERQLELTAEDFRAAREAALAALRGGEALTRKVLLARLEEAGVSTQNQRGYYLLWHLSQEGLLCFGPMRDKQPTFVLLDEWLPPTPPIPRDEAITLFARRYFNGHGPATLQDLARWAGIGVPEARAGLQAVADEFESAEIDGAVHWFAPEAELARAKTRASGDPDGCRLLPAFDEYLVGYGKREPMFTEFHGRYHSRVAANGILTPTVLMGGLVVGTWKRSLRPREVVITVEAFRTLHKSERRNLAEQVAAYGDYLGLPARLAE